MNPMEIQETIREIKAQFRLAMNGVASASMRDKGVAYKVNFGIEWPRLYQIAQPYGKDAALAALLWKDPVRECRLMATAIQPVESFGEDLADLWIEQADTLELVEYLAMNLLQFIPQAADAAFRWMASERPLTATAGFLTLAHLLRQGVLLNERSCYEFLDQAEVALRGDNHSLVKAARTALMRYAALGESESEAVGRLFAC